MTDRFELPSWECYRLIADCTVGRLCVIDHGYPLALPLNFRLVQEGSPPRLVMRTAAHTMFANYEGPASVEVDHISDSTRSAWSVLLRGDLRRVVGGHDLPDPNPWVADGRFQWLVLDVTAVSGRRFVGQAHDDGFSVDWVMTA